MLSTNNRVRFVTIKKFSAETGYTEGAVRNKISTGVWLQDQVWIKAPDGRVLIDLEHYELWVERARNPR